MWDNVEYNAQEKTAHRRIYNQENVGELHGLQRKSLFTPSFEASINSTAHIFAVVA